MSRNSASSVLARLSQSWPAYAVLFCSVCATSFVYSWTGSQFRKQQEAQFEREQNKFRLAMELHFSSYFNILNGVKAFCAGKTPPAPAEFNQYFDSLGVRQDHLAISDIGFIARTRASERQALLEQAWQFGTRKLAVFPNDTNDYFVLQYWDDFSSSPPQGVFGSYIYSERERIRAMNQARDSDEIVGTDRLTVVLNNDRHLTNGFILFVPTYRPGRGVATIEKRREALAGFVFASFSAYDCWKSIFDSTGEPQLDIEVYSGRARTRGSLWFDSDSVLRTAVETEPQLRPQLTSAQTFTGLGREWTVCMSARPGFEDASVRWVPRMILLGGGALSALLFGMFLIQLRARFSTEALAADLRAMSQTLKEEKERLAVTLASISECVVTVDAQGRVVLLNRAAEELSRCSQEQARGQRIEKLFAIEEASSLKAMEWPIARVIHSGAVWHTPQPVLLRARNGGAFLAAITGSPMRSASGEIEGAVVVMRDVTERQKLLEEQVKSSKLESVGLLAGGIAHDFNNILTAIMGNVSMAEMESESRPEVADYLKEAGLGCERARELTQQLLTFAKGGSPVRKTANLTDVVRDSARFAMHGSSARCEFDLAPDLWLVEADKGQIGQVIQNIILNASQAMPGGGIIRVSAANERIEPKNPQGLKPGRYARISVQDEGVGIHPDHLQRVFDPYFSTKQRGSGLGLATAYSIIRRHDGVITASSKLGQGSRFDVYLPASDNPSAEAAPPPAARPHSGGGWVLVMDDEQAVLSLLSKMLEKLGYQVIAARDGAEAIRLYADAQERGREIVAVIFDLTVPGGVGGRQAMEELRAMDPRVKGIVSSGYSNDPVMANHRDFGFQAVVSKPYRLETLAAALETLK